jgi:hypothetical protein
MKKQVITTLCGLCLSVVLAVPASSQIYVHVGPPAPRHEVIPPPRAGYEWHEGYNRWDGHRYVWTPGVYVVAHPHEHWVAGHWDHNRHGNFWVEGHYVR